MRYRSRPALIVALLVCATGCHDKGPKQVVATAAPSAGPTSSASAASAASAALAESAPSASASQAAVASASAAPVASAAPAASAGAKTPPTGSAGKAGASGPVVKLLSPGAAPRQKLRYHLAKGKIEKFKLTSATSMTIHLAGRAMPAPAIPTLEMLARIQVRSVSPDGVAKRDLRIQKVQLADPDKVPSALRHSVEDSLGEMAKLKGHDEIDSRGRLLSSKLDTSGLDDGQVKQMMQAMATAFGEVSAPFPAEAVGKGARWQVSTEVEQLGMKMKQVATYTLEKLDGEHGTTRVALQQSAPGSRIQIPGVPLNVDSELLGMSGTGKGEIQFDLTHSLPEGHISTQSHVKVRTKMAGRSQDTQMDMALTETFTRI